MTKDKEGTVKKMSKMSLRERIALIIPDSALNLLILVIPLICVVLYSVWTTDLEGL